MDVDTTGLIRATEKGWREADLHSLRVLYACLLSDIAAHRWDVQRGEDRQEADWRLWAIADKELR